MCDNKLFARGDFVAHEHCKDLIGSLRVLNTDEFHASVHRIHRGLPELLGIHFSQTLVPLDDDRFAVELFPVFD